MLKQALPGYECYMSHIEIPDGVLPVAWWLAGYLLTIVILFIIGRRNKWRKMRLKIPLLGVTTS
ncbi:MAG: hypothetical protein E3J54_03705, partial [Actinobacteria bacterium]